MSNIARRLADDVSWLAAAGDEATSEPQPVSDEQINRQVGLRVRRRRSSLGLTQAALAERIGVTFQQVQKYETGSNRIAAATLIRLADALQVTVGWLVEGIGVGTQAPSAPPLRPDRERELSVIAGSYLSLPEEVRASVRALIVTLAKPEPPPGG